MEKDDLAIKTSDHLANLRWRYAVKKFDAHRKIPSVTWEALAESLRLSPSSFGLQPWKFFVVESPTLREKIKPVAWNQDQITDASHLVVFCVKKDIGPSDVKRFIATIATTRGVSTESLADYEKRMTNFLTRPPEHFDPNQWATRQVYIALGFFLTSAATLGVDTCPIEGFDPLQVNQILGLDARGYRSVVMAAAGYRAKDDKYAEAPKVRYPLQEILDVL